MSAIDQILQFLGTVVIYGGGSSLVAFYIFRTLGKGWIEARFAERLESYKHEQAKELQKLNMEFESILSGALKLQDRDFTILPEIWIKLTSAYSSTKKLICIIQNRVRIDDFDHEHLNEILSKSVLSVSERSEVLEARDMTQTFYNIAYCYEFSDTLLKINELDEIIVLNSLFLEHAMKDKLNILEVTCQKFLSYIK